MGRFPSVTHPFAARRQDCSRVTARLACVRHAASVQSEPGSNSSLKGYELLSIERSKAHCWTFGPRSLLQRHRRESPHKLPAKLLNNAHGRIGPKQGAGSIASGHIPSITLELAIIPPGTICCTGVRGAQYSDREGPVNASHQADGRVAPERQGYLTVRPYVGLDTTITRLKDPRLRR
jgi:hypothetical protein